MKAMTKKEFKRRWDSDELGGGITLEDVAKCAEAWGLFSHPRTEDVNKVVEAVLKAAGAEI